jgi:hypothetical protein
MDYEGQKLSELIFYWIICSFGAVGWVIGYFQQDFTLCFYAWSIGVLLSVVSRSTAVFAGFYIDYMLTFPVFFLAFRSFVYLIGQSTTGIR